MEPRSRPLHCQLESTVIAARAALTLAEKRQGVRMRALPADRPRSRDGDARGLAGLCDTAP